MLRQMVSPLGRRWSVLLTSLVLVGCVSETTLAPTPAIYTGEGARQQFVTSSLQRPDHSLLYVTNRASVLGPDGRLAYSSDRSRSMSFGSVDIAVDRRPGQEGGGDLKVGAITELGAFPKSPYSLEITRAGYRRAPDAIQAHEKAVSELQAQVARRVAGSARKEVVVFVHGYNNSFEDAVRSTGNLCEFLGEEFVCVLVSWPAGGSKGILFGYNVDRESGEFAVSDVRKAIRAIADTQGVRKIHFIAHSRGTDVLASALQQLGIESYVTQSALSTRLKVANVVLCAPDMDLDVAASKIFTIGSDPDLPFGKEPKPSVTIPTGSLHLTVYSSPDDKALEVSGLLFGSIIRLGQLAVSQHDPRLREAPQLAGLADFIEFTGGSSLLGHDYFLSNPKVSADLVALIRYGLKPGEPGRPLEEVQRPFWRINAGVGHGY
jgi:esterase/lipase superfamily enzyme